MLMCKNITLNMLDTMIRALRVKNYLIKELGPRSLQIYIYIYIDIYILGKTHFEVPVLLFFLTFRPCTFILRHYIFVLLFSYRFRPSQLQNRRPGFFFPVVDICTALGFPQLHIGSSVAALPPSSTIFFSRIS